MVAHNWDRESETICEDFKLAEGKVANVAFKTMNKEITKNRKKESYTKEEK